MTSTKELRGKALGNLRAQVAALQSADASVGAEDQPRFAREYQSGVDAILRMLDNQIKQTVDTPEEPPVPTSGKPDMNAEARRLRGVLRQLAELPAARLSEVAPTALKALAEQPRPAVSMGRPSGGFGGGGHGGGGDRKFTPRRPENRGRSNSGR